MTRIIHRTAARPHRLIAEALQCLVLGEILDPGGRLVIVTPWISDVPILDNRNGRFSALEPTWPASRVRLSAIIRLLLHKQTKVHLACGPGPREEDFCARLRQAAQLEGTERHLTVRRSLLDPAKVMDHQKAIAGDQWIIHGSMNLTYRGVELNGELVTVSTDRPYVATVTTELMGLFA